MGGGGRCSEACRKQEAASCCSEREGGGRRHAHAAGGGAVRGVGRRCSEGYRKQEAAVVIALVCAVARQIQCPVQVAVLAREGEPGHLCEGLTPDGQPAQDAVVALCVALCQLADGSEKGALLRVRLRLPEHVPRRHFEHPAHASHQQH